MITDPADVLRVVPVTLAEARQFVATHHSHNPIPPVGHVVSLGIERAGVLVAVAIGGRPVARGLDLGAGEITRVCVSGKGQHRNACSMATGRMRTVLASLGRRPVYTYTLAEECAACVRAAGFRLDAELSARETWDTPSRPRVQTDLFGVERRPPGPKKRWVWP